MDLMYSNDSFGWFMDKDGVHAFKSCEGYHQGDVLGSWAFCFTIQPLLDSLKQYIVEKYGPTLLFLIAFYVDDGTLAGPSEVVLDMLAFLIEHGPQYGYILNPSKGVLLIGQEQTRPVADIIRDYQQLGIAADIIRTLTSPTNIAARVTYGMKLLGSFVGTQQYRISALSEYHHRLQPVEDALKKYRWLQGAFLLFTKCYTPKIDHLLRTIPPNLTRSLVCAFEKSKSSLLYHFLGRQQDTQSDLGLQTPLAIDIQASLPISEGGLGLFFHSITASVAYLSSFMQFLCHHPKLLQQAQSFASGLQPPLPPQFNHLIAFFYAIKSQWPSKQYLESLTDLEIMCRTNPQHVQHSLYLELLQRKVQSYHQQLPPSTHMWMGSLLGDHSGAWLAAIPHYESDFFSNVDFVIALRYRLLCPQAVVTPGMRCSCRAGCILDEFGHHLASGCAKDAHRIYTHNRVRDVLAKIIMEAGFTGVQVEPRWAFSELDPADNARPDILVPEGHEVAESGRRNLLIDVSLCGPLIGAASGHLDMTTNFYELMAKRCSAKRSHYEAKATQLHMVFLPFVLLTSGAFHPEASEYINFLARRASKRRRIPFDNLYAHYTRRISIALQHGVTRAIRLGALSALGGEVVGARQRPAVHEYAQAEIALQDSFQARFKTLQWPQIEDEIDFAGQG